MDQDSDAEHYTYVFDWKKLKHVICENKIRVP